MTEDEANAFVRSFAAAWSTRDGEAMQALWQPDGRLFTPIVDRPVRPDELPKLVAAQTRMIPDLAWQLVDWAVRDDIVYVEWRVTQTLAGTALEWCGVDRFVMKDGRLVEERVYADTAPMRLLSGGAERENIVAASRDGTSPTPMIRL